MSDQEHNVENWLDAQLKEAERDMKRSDLIEANRWRPFQRVIDEINIKHVVSILGDIRNALIAIFVVLIAIGFKIFGLI